MGKLILVCTLIGAALVALAKPITESAASAVTLLASEALSRGRRVYQANCAVCHGLDGDGRGMAASMLVTQPRNFQTGLFKFRSTPSGALPTDEDLLKVVADGVRWTAMVGRADLPDADRRAVVQYIKTFSPRFANDAIPAKIIAPARPAQSVEVTARGRQIYRDADCAKCHGERGDGKGVSSAELVDEQGRPLPASNLTWRPLKRGSRLADLYLSIATGLNGTPMPAYADALDEQETWALVYYLESLVPAAHKRSAHELLGEEQRGWMILRMHGGTVSRGFNR